MTLIKAQLKNNNKERKKWVKLICKNNTENYHNYYYEKVQQNWEYKIVTETLERMKTKIDGNFKNLSLKSYYHDRRKKNEISDQNKYRNIIKHDSESIRIDTYKRRKVSFFKRLKLLIQTHFI